MSIRDGYFNRGTSRWVDGSGNSQYAEATIPYVTRREKLTFTLNVVETDSDTGVTGPSVAWAGQSLTYRFFVDNDYKNYITGTLNTAITAGPITEIKIDGFGTDTDQILSTGRISLTNTLNESETFSYTGFTESGGVYTFVVSATAAYSYAIGDSARVVEASLIEVDNVDIDSTDDDTGILIITMDANNQAFIDAGDAAAAAEIDGCRFEIQVLDTEPRIIDTIGGEWRCLNLLVDDFATPPPAPGTNYYTKIESDARFLIKSGSSGGQTAYGGTGTGENLFLYSNTSNNGFIGIGQNMSVNEANGRVLIGSGTTAQCALHLYTDSGAICQRIESTDASNGVMQLQLYNDSDKELSLGKLGSTTSVGTFGAGSGAILNRDGDFNVVADSNNPIKFYTDATDSQNLSATEKMRLTAAGTLCINQPSGPTGTELFHVAGDVRLGGASTNRKIFGPTDASLQLIADPNATDEGIRFSVDGTGTATAMFIAENGDVRIGYEAPYSNEEFGVAGDAYIDGQLDVTDDATIDGMYVGSRGATSNTFLGEAAGNSFTGSTSVGIGARAAFNNISGSTWTAVGRDAAYNATGSQWVAAGYQAGYNCTANGWLAAGYRAAYNNVSGNSWVAIGQEAAFNATGSSFISIGYRSAYELQASSNWVAIGYFAGRYQVGGTTALTSAPNSMYLGYQTKGTQGASNEIVIGYTAEGNGSNTVTLGNDSITDTYLKGDVDVAGALTVTDDATIDGLYVGTRGISTGTVVGKESAPNSTGVDTTAYGYRSAYSNTTGQRFFAGGSNAGYSNDTASFWVYLGFQSGYYLNSNSTIAIGYQAAIHQNGTTTPLTANSESVFIGRSTKGTQSATNEIVIGYQAEGNGSNTVTLGNDSITDTYLKGNVDIQDNKYIYLYGDSDTNGSVRLSYQTSSSSILEEIRVSGSWVTKHTRSMA